MASNKPTNPFEDEKPQIVHLEKDQSHYEYCRMQMHDIEHVHRRTFFCNLGLCVLVCMLSIFRVYIGGFDLMSSGFNGESGPSTILVFGIFQILIAILIIILGYLAWANFRRLNYFLLMWYVLVLIIGIGRLDYITALFGVVGAAFYFLSVREVGRENVLSEMEGYPEFHEKFDISKTDFVVETLLAHTGDKKKKSSLFTTDYSLRRLKKKKDGDPDAEKEPETDAAQSLAEDLKKHIAEARSKKEPADTVSTEQQSAADESVSDTMEELTEEPAAAEPEFADALPEEPAEKASAQDDAEAAAKSSAETILAEAEAKAKAILAEAVAKAEAVKAGSAEQSAPAKEAAGQTSAANRNRQNSNQRNRNRKRK
ncbi:MAG: hypothetical protein K5705_02715 [Oscillospiraceae bacterium]|nr:hypothetical protein [Oscillospiraceae bacterium]MCR4759183.1 hypothetical protein [Oscillospiraceae bacterium]